MPDKPIQVIIPKDINIHIHHYDHRSKNGEEKIIELVGLVLNKLNKMAIVSVEQWQEVLAKIDAASTKGSTASTAIANRITALEDAIKNAGLDAETEALLLAQTEGLVPNLEALATTLEAMGKAPETPVPVDPPEPVEPVEV